MSIFKKARKYRRFLTVRIIHGWYYNHNIAICKLFYITIFTLIENNMKVFFFLNTILYARGRIGYKILPINTCTRLFRISFRRHTLRRRFIRFPSRALQIKNKKPIATAIGSFLQDKDDSRIDSYFVSPLPYCLF